MQTNFCYILLFLSSIIVFTSAQFDDFIDLSELSTVFETDRLPTDEDGNLLPRYMASVGNGHVATTLHTDSVLMNGLYNGFKGESHRARIPSRNNLRINQTNAVQEERRYALNLERGVFVETITTEDYEIKLTTFAHRHYHKVIVSQITVTTGTPGGEPLVLTIDSITGSESEDITFDPDADYPGSPIPSVFTCGETNEVEDPQYQQFNSTACVIASKVDAEVSVSSNTTFTYFAAYDVDYEGASADFNAVVTLIGAGDPEALLNSHTEAWGKVWEDGRIEVAGNVQLEKVIYGSLYYILSSLPVTAETNSPVGQFYGLSPGGLGYGTRLMDYQGHSFWDTEIWMYPPILYFYPKAAREILNYRLHVVDAARDLANDTNHAGARFPWEGGFTGREVTPDCCPETRDFQIHITADVAFAIRQYIAVTRDSGWLKTTQSNNLVNGCGLIHEIAQFWASRIVCEGGNDFCEINHVMPPDEDHHDVNNSVYTNVMAGYAIFFAKYAKCLCGESMDDVPESWLENAELLKLIFDERLNYHPEFDGYTPGTHIKQADVVLLGFPLLYQMDPEIRENDLNIYEPVTRPDGPAMTWAMHTIGFLDLDETNRAEAIFNRSYQSYVRQPYKIWTEAQPPTLGAVNFITGMGGFLQSIVSGYGGLRLYPEKIVFSKPRVPPNSESLKLVGLNFLENEFTLLVEKTQVTITFTARSTNYPVRLHNSVGAPILIDNNQAIIDASAGPTTFTLTTSTQTDCPLPLDKIKLVPVPQEPETTEENGGESSQNPKTTEADGEVTTNEPKTTEENGGESSQNPKTTEADGEVTTNEPKTTEENGGESSQNPETTKADGGVSTRVPELPGTTESGSSIIAATNFLVVIFAAAFTALEF